MKCWRLCSGLITVMVQTLGNLALVAATTWAAMDQIMEGVLKGTTVGVEAAETLEVGVDGDADEAAPAVQERQEKELGEVEVGVDGDADEAALVEALGAEVEGAWRDLAWDMPSIGFVSQTPAPQYQFTAMTEKICL